MHIQHGLSSDTSSYLSMTFDSVWLIINMVLYLSLIITMVSEVCDLFNSYFFLLNIYKQNRC